MPEGWAWCRLGELFYHTTGKALKKSNNKGSLRKYITTSNLYWNKFDFTEVREMYFTDDELDKCTIKKGDLVLCNGGDVGRAAIWNFDEDICYQNHVSRLRPKIIGINNKLYLYLLMFYKEQGMLNGKGVGITSLSANDLLSGLFPLPPINEQDQIVIKIENIFSQIDYIDDNKSDLQTAINKTKSKILDLAIHGKLVPQDSNDEPAEELLKRIATSDNRPYKKLDDEGPFDIPESWAWCKLGEICDYGKCINVNSSDLKADDWILDLEDIEKDSGKIIAFHNFGERKSESTKHKFLKGQVLYSKLRPYLNKVVIAPKDGFCTSEILPLDFKGILLPRYAQVLLMSSYFLEMVNMVTYGVKMPRLGTNDAKNMHIPLPPLAEQQRIFSKIENLFSILDSILVNLE